MTDSSLTSSAANSKNNNRAGFSSRLGFVLATAGSAVGLGNIWSYPTQVAQNGGAAFVLIYFLLTVLLAYPALIAELMIGRHGQGDPVTALRNLPADNVWRPVTQLSALIAVLMVCLIFSFYSIVGGWIAGFTLSPVAELIGFQSASQWLESLSPARDLLLASLFIIATLAIVNGGVREGIERWSARLMPMLIVLLCALIIMVMTREGAVEGLRHYLIPDLSRISPSLIVSALGQAFFSMSLGAGAMMVYGSYLSRRSNLPLMAFQVCALDTFIAFLAGLLIIPAMFVALHLGINIYAESGELLNSDTLVFQVLPNLFKTMGGAGTLVALAFFSLLTIAALTSSISMLEVPVSCLVERANMPRKRASALVCLGIFLVVALIISAFDPLFGTVVTLTTRYALPINGLLFCLFAGWLMGRNRKLQEIKMGWPEVEHSWFWKIWPWYIRLVCPALIALIFYHQLL